MMTLGAIRLCNIIRISDLAGNLPRPKRLILMPVHKRPQDAPVLELTGDLMSIKHMKNHVLHASMAF